MLQLLPLWPKSNPVESNPYLDVELSCTVLWDTHIDKCVKKAFFALGLLKRSIHGAPQDGKGTTFKSIVKPTLEYVASA